MNIRANKRVYSKIIICELENDIKRTTNIFYIYCSTYTYVKFLYKCIRNENLVTYIFTEA